MEKKIELVKMYREDTPSYSADVHPDEVENYKLGGWRVGEAKAVEQKPVEPVVVVANEKPVAANNGWGSAPPPSA